MKSRPLPSDRTHGLSFIVPDDWTPEQALAVFEPLDDLRETRHSAQPDPLQPVETRRGTNGRYQMWIHRSMQHRKCDRGWRPTGTGASRGPVNRRLHRRCGTIWQNWGRIAGGLLTQLRRFPIGWLSTISRVRQWDTLPARSYQHNLDNNQLRVRDMTILQLSSKASDRPLGEWYEQIRTGQLRLPRFQRFEAWDRGRVLGFLNAVIQNLPVGVTLLLQVGDHEKFKSRNVATAPETGGRVTEHLLDGQQRLTAFWRAMHNNYDGEIYFVYLPQFDANKDENDGGEMRIAYQGRWMHNAEVRPKWITDERKCLARGLVPVNLLRPGDLGVAIDGWITAATQHLEPCEGDEDGMRRLKQLFDTRASLKAIITTLRERVVHFNLPYLALPASTDPDVALRVFVNMNTNSKPLSMFDLTVAKVEEVAGASLHDLQERFEVAHPEVTHYGDLASPLLQIGALLQGVEPNQSGITRMDKKKLVEDWNRIERAMVRAAEFLRHEKVYDAARLPTNVVLPVIAACMDIIPAVGDARGRGERLLRAYFWSVCFTIRYEGAAATRSFQDYKALAALLNSGNFGPGDYKQVPVLDRDVYELPKPEELLRVGWPKGADRIAREILAATLYFGGWDFADGRPVSYESLKTREYHHVFPDALLEEAGIDSYLALNCALITWKTNRSIGRKDPLEYLKDRVEWSSEADVRQRLKSHLLDYDLLASARYVDEHGQALVGEELKTKLAPEFQAFLEARARCLSVTIEKLAAGEIPGTESVLARAALSVVETKE